MDINQVVDTRPDEASLWQISWLVLADNGDLSAGTECRLEGQRESNVEGATSRQVKTDHLVIHTLNCHPSSRPGTRRPVNLG